MNYSKFFTEFKNHFSHPKKIFHTIFWFTIGAVLGLFFFAGLIALYYKHAYANTIYPGISVDRIQLGGKSPDEVETYFRQKNKKLHDTLLIFKTPEMTASVSAEELKIGYDEELLAMQAYSIGRGDNVFSNLHLIFQAYTDGINLQPAYHYSHKALEKTLTPFIEEINREPVNARFTFHDGRVAEFQSASPGKAVDVEAVKNSLIENVLSARAQNVPQLVINIPIKDIEPEVSNDEVNNLGITEQIGVGTSLFAGSIENRIYNLTLASNRLNGVLVKPGEIFSFNQTVGDISTLTGYKQAYIISGGRTILGDGGGVCQVSTTLFRAILNAGLPIVERNPHAYRVSYYEQDSPPGIDAAIYTPTVDLKFKNDTGHHILIQSYVDPANAQLTFALYGTNDGRVSVVNDPVIVSQTPAPEPLYQDDPTLPKGEMKQIDWAAPGAVVYFTRTVTRNGEVIISDKYTSNYRPWQAVYLKGTKEG